jgi:hypothetical protein
MTKRSSLARLDIGKTVLAYISISITELVRLSRFDCIRFRLVLQMSGSPRFRLLNTRQMHYLYVQYTEQLNKESLPNMY